ncbi:ribosomal L1 domain-containing protein 1-like [Asparagus officinalis]|uniref:ribosomal L1 domain-containing protein 1-like n=1 Tax=Asparagus officinalis TaxID=4686 RepID=UPI00098E56CD|nr:ribosomal L1 domain-containing protein 1-like [Asparagus officinalis]
MALPISSVIGLSELQSDYKPFESRRKLCDSYDLFFAERKLLPLLPRLLGKHFFKRKKTPLAVDFSRVGWVEQIKSWCGSSLLYLRSGSCSGLKIGRVNQSLDEIVENAMAAVEGAMEAVPRGWKNLRSVHVKTADSVALPVYQKVPEIGMKIEGVWDEKEGEKKRKREKVKKGKIDEDVGVEKRVKKKLKKDEDKKRVKGSEIKGDRLMVTEDEEGSALLNGDEERHADNQLSENKVKNKKKKKKMEVDSIVASEGTKKRKLKKMRDDVDVALNDELGTKNKARKGGKAKEVKDLGDEDVEEGNVVNELSEKRIKKKKKVEGSAGMKKSKPKMPRT